MKKPSIGMPRRTFLGLATLGCACGGLSAYVLAGNPKAKSGGHEKHDAPHDAHASDAAPSKGASAHADKPHWQYEGDGGPEHWGELSPEFKSCQLGMEQTPIDLSGSIKGDAGAVHFNYKPLSLRILNNGHTIQVNADPGCFVTIGGVRYELLQFHFHHPSEHLLDGKAFDMELHLVHKSAEGGLAVVGVFFRAGATNAAIQPIFDQMPKSEGPEAKTKGNCNPAAFLPKSRAYYRYMGSLTTPPCTEGLTWTIFKDPVEISQDQINQFAELFPNNARPVQRRHRRFLIETSSAT